MPKETLPPPAIKNSWKPKPEFTPSQCYDNNIHIWHGEVGLYIDRGKRVHPAERTVYKRLMRNNAAFNRVVTLGDITFESDVFPKILHTGNIPSRPNFDSDAQIVTSVIDGHRYSEARPLGSKDKALATKYITSLGHGLQLLFDNNLVHTGLAQHRDTSIFLDHNKEKLTMSRLDLIMTPEEAVNNTYVYGFSEERVWRNYGKDIAQTVVGLFDRTKKYFGEIRHPNGDRLSFEAKRSAVASSLVVDHNFSFPLAGLIGRFCFMQPEDECTREDVRSLVEMMAEHSSSSTFVSNDSNRQLMRNYQITHPDRADSEFVDAFGNTLTFAELRILGNDDRTIMHHLKDSQGDIFHVAAQTVLVTEHSQIMWNAVS